MKTKEATDRQRRLYRRIEEEIREEDEGRGKL